MGRTKPTRKYNGETYYRYLIVSTKREAEVEAGGLKRSGKWKARIAKVKGGYIIFRARQK